MYLKSYPITLWTPRMCLIAPTHDYNTPRTPVKAPRQALSSLPPVIAVLSRDHLSQVGQLWHVDIMALIFPSDLLYQCNNWCYFWISERFPREGNAFLKTIKNTFSFFSHLKLKHFTGALTKFSFAPHVWLLSSHSPALNLHSGLCHVMYLWC